MSDNPFRSGRKFLSLTDRGAETFRIDGVERKQATFKGNPLYWDDAHTEPRMQDVCRVTDTKGNELEWSVPNKDIKKRLEKLYDKAGGAFPFWVTLQRHTDKGDKPVVYTIDLAPEHELPAEPASEPAVDDVPF
jgi:hypothetical protein